MMRAITKTGSRLPLRELPSLQLLGEHPRRHAPLLWVWLLPAVITRGRRV